MKFQLVDEWRRFYTMYSIWAFAIIGLAPDIYNLAVQFNMVSGDNAPAALARVINMIAFAGAVLRLVKQKKLELEVTEPAKADVDAVKK
jgi:hypothetical protein